MDRRKRKEVGLSLRPGQNGTKKLVKKYGTNLIMVRYRYFDGFRLKTVELIEEKIKL